MTFLNWPLPLSHQNYWLKNIQLPLPLSDLSALVYKWSISFQNICQVTDPPWGFRSVCVERDGERERARERESARESAREREMKGVWLLARAGLFYSSGYRSVEQQLWADGNKEAWLSTLCPPPLSFLSWEIPGFMAYISFSGVFALRWWAPSLRAAGRDNQLWCPILSEGRGVFERIWRIYLILDHILAYYISAEDSSCNNIHPQMRIPLIENEYIL